MSMSARINDRPTFESVAVVVRILTMSSGLKKYENATDLQPFYSDNLLLNPVKH